MSSYLIFRRSISTTCSCFGKRNFRKFLLHNKRGSKAFKEDQAKNPNSDIPIDHRGVRKTGYLENGKFVEIPELIPEIIVPSLEGFNLKPYVSYKSEDVVQPEFTAKDLFSIIYAPKIYEDYKNNKLDENGDPLDPSENEKLTPEEAKKNARRTGSDIYLDHEFIRNL